jgi:hypothetical protein
MIDPTPYAPKNSSPSPKFLRRPDLSPSIRIQIACAAVVAKLSGQWGAITRIARQFMISRTFVYMLAAGMQQAGERLFQEPSRLPSSNDERLPYRWMLSLRLEGRCSLGAISTIMSRFDVSPSSSGTVSQVLQRIGRLLPNTLSTHANEVRFVVFVSDELFAHGFPILVTVEPQSSALLRVELVNTRDWTQWKRHWECLEDNGYHALYLVSDEGSALTKAQKETLKDIIRQPDTFHAIAHRLGRYVARFDAAAYTAIEKEYEAAKRITRATTKASRKQRRAEYTRARKTAVLKIDRADAFRDLYQCLVQELQLFDHTGHLRDRQTAEGNIEAALDLLDTLNIKAVTKAAKTIRKLLPDLLNYFTVADSVVASLNELPYEPDTLNSLCLAWQWHKAIVKAKTTAARHYCTARESDALQCAAKGLGIEMDAAKHLVYQQLDQIVQSSSLVECLNSILRPYMNTTRNHVTQELLNLVMFYHNHRRYQDGKRKGHTPMELLTGTPQTQDWLDRLFEVIEHTQPHFFASAR